MRQRSKTRGKRSDKRATRGENKKSRKAREIRERGWQRKREKSNKLESSDKMDRGAAIVIGFFVLNGERNNETETLILRVLIRIFVLCCNLTVTKKKFRNEKEL